MSIIRCVRAGVFALALAMAAPAHDIITTNLTYTRDISRIFAQRCVACHAEDSAIPLTTYEEARPWAVGIKEQVLSRAMPPWGAVKGFGNLAPDGALSQEEIMIISAWVIGGAPKGDPQLLAKAERAPMQAKSKGASSPVLQDGPTVSDQSVLHSAIHVSGIRPLANHVVSSARVTALFPDGRIEPLVWLYRYDPRNSHSFVFREQLDLPKGTVIRSPASLSLVLQVAPKGSSPGV
jgi:mono/diheme cytochrome c family protein